MESQRFLCRTTVWTMTVGLVLMVLALNVDAQEQLASSRVEPTMGEAWVTNVPGGGATAASATSEVGARPNQRGESWAPSMAVPDGSEGMVHVCGHPRTVTWTPLVSAAIRTAQRDNLWQESNLHGYLGPCDTLTLLPGLDQIQATLEDPAHEDQLRCLWDLGMLAEAGTNPTHDPASGRAILVTPAKRQAVLNECQAAAAAHQDGYLNDQVRALARTFTLEAQEAPSLRAVRSSAEMVGGGQQGVR